MKLRPCRLVVSILVSVGGGWASQPVLTFREALQTALDRSADIRSSREDLSALTFESQAALGGFDWNWKTTAVGNTLGIYDNFLVDSLVEKPLGPWSSNLFAGYRWSGGDFAIYDGKMETGRQGEVRMGARFSLWRNRDIDRRRVQLSVAKLGEKAGDAALEQTTLASLREVSKKYWDFALAHQRLKIARRLLEVGQDRHRFLEQRFQHGDIPKFDVDDNLRSILQRKAQVVQAERQVQAEANRLSVLLQIPIDPERDTEAGLLDRSEQIARDPLPSFDALLSTARERRPEFSRLAAMAEQQKTEARFQSNAANPKLDLQVGAAREFGEGDIPLSETNLETQLWLEIPLQRREARGKLGAASARIRRLEIHRELLDRQLEAEIRDVSQAFEAITARVALAKEERDLAQSLEEGERKRFLHGESNLIFLNVREQTLYDASIRYLETLVEYRKLTADRLAVTAAPVASWLSQ